MPDHQQLLHWVKAFAVVVVAFFAPIHQLIGLTLLIILVDLVLGILAARKRNEKIESRKLRRTVGKIVAYETGILFAFIIETHFTFGLPVVKIVTSVIGLTETKSVFENLAVVTGVDFLQALIDKVQGSLNKKE